MVILKEKMPSGIDPKQVLQRAFAFDKVTKSNMLILEQTYKSDKRDKRFLFLEDEDPDQTILKTLPNLPDDEIMTECNVDEDDSEGAQCDELF